MTLPFQCIKLPPGQVEQFGWPSVEHFGWPSGALTADGQNRTLYSFRHTYATLELLQEFMRRNGPKPSTTNGSEI